MTDVLLIIQARMGSSRLPGKIIKNLNGRPLILRLIDSLQEANTKFDIVVATSTDPNNIPLIKLLKENGIKFFMGSEQNVYSRFRTLVDQYNPDVVVRATADDPLMSGKVLDILIDEVKSSNLDYVFMEGLPKGISPEVIRAESFRRLDAYYLNSDELEHVTLAFKNRPELFNLKICEPLKELNYPELTLTVDTEDEFTQMNNLFEKFGDKISLGDVLWELNKK